MPAIFEVPDNASQVTLRHLPGGRRQWGNFPRHGGCLFPKPRNLAPERVSRSGILHQVQAYNFGTQLQNNACQPPLKHKKTVIPLGWLPDIYGVIRCLAKQAAFFQCADGFAYFKAIVVNFNLIFTLL